MKELQHTEVLPAILPVAIKDNAAWASQVIDCADADYVEFHVMVGVTDVALAVMKIMESDVKTNPTTLGGTPAEVLDVTTKPGADDDGGVWIIGVNMKNARSRYLQLQATAGDGTSGTYLAATAVVSRSGVRPSTAAGRAADFVEYV